MNKKLISFLAISSLVVSLTACTAQNESNSSSNKTTTETTTQTKDYNLETIGEIDTYIKLGDSTSVDGEGASVKDNVITISKAGTYSISGTLSDGQLLVDAGDKDDVYIVLNNADITCSNNAPINIVNADKVVLSTEKDSENNITDGKTYELEADSDEPNAAIFSKADLVLMGEGTLNIKGNYNNGVTSKDDLRIQSGTLNVEATNHGLKGKDCVLIIDGDISITSEGDGIKSTNTKDTDKGYVQIENGNIDITSGEDGIQAETNLIINNGNIKLSTGGGSQNSSTKKDWGNWGPNIDKNTQTSDDSESEKSAKGIKASQSIEINEGTLNIDSSDDSIHSNGTIKIKSGDIDAKSGDDGIHADESLQIDGGDINITKSYEGLESENITINDGKINVVSSDDGINISGGSDSSSQNRQGANSFESTGDGKLTINNGQIIVDADGDGLDANGSIEMNDGLVVVNGPTSGGDGSLDYDDTFNLNGGTLIAAGSNGMLQNPSESSKQNIISTVLTTQKANTLVHIEDEDKNEILTFSPTKEYASIIVSSSDIKEGSTYKVYVGGEYSGDSENGIYSNGTYSNGEEVGSVKVSSSISQITQDGASTSTAPGSQNGGGGDRGGNRPNDKGNGGPGGNKK